MESRSHERGKRLARNSIVSIASQGITIICNFWLTRLLLQAFGSETNGLVSSISQFLGFIAFLEMGIGAVVKSALYEPLAKNDLFEISKIVVSCKRFYHKIAGALVLYTGILAIAFPMIFNSQFDWIYVFSLVVIISISLFAQYFFGVSYQLLLNADQKTYIPTAVCCGTLVVNTLISAVLIRAGASIQVVKLAASLIYTVRPLIYVQYVKGHYQLDERIKLTEEPLKQKWNGVAQHLAYVVVNYTDIVVLTLLSTLSNVSIYTVYHNVTIGVQQIISNLSVGISAMIGNVLYSESKSALNRVFSTVEWAFHFITVLFFTITGILILPFVQVYTTGVNDADYIVPAFAVLITLAQASYSIRTPYETLVLAANHFKQTQKSAIIEAAINIGVSVFLVSTMGLVGVAIGTFAAMTYRTVYFVLYLRKNILGYRIERFIKLLACDVLQVMICVLVCYVIGGFALDGISWGKLFILGMKDGIACLLICTCMNAVFFRDDMTQIANRLVKRK